MLQPRDLFVALKLHLTSDPMTSFAKLGRDIGLSDSTMHRSVRRLVEAGLVTSERTVRRADLRDLLVHGVRYVYYVRAGEPTRGLPTAFAARPLDTMLASGEEVPVWPDPDGAVRGYAVQPLDAHVPDAARRDPELYELLALVDAIRIGRPRDVALASQELTRRLSSGANGSRDA
ncbi:MAG: winged helix-turn-helix transcriptional regulator [Deinococcus-Thermus bacterium]|jgi:DNA-binding Lrp family transcriptional regulator|nr:winged helix-turn-helix transcriptional regulator [Deinococcota bacterium]